MIKRLFFVVLFSIQILFCFSEKVYKETINGVYIGKWMELSSVKEFDKNGNMVFLQTSEKTEYYEYDEKGDMIHYKDSKGYES